MLVGGTAEVLAGTVVVLAGAVVVLAGALALLRRSPHPSSPHPSSPPASRLHKPARATSLRAFCPSAVRAAADPRAGRDSFDPAGPSVSSRLSTSPAPALLLTRSARGKLARTSVHGSARATNLNTSKRKPKLLRRRSPPSDPPSPPQSHSRSGGHQACRPLLASRRALGGGCHSSAARSHCASLAAAS